MMRKIPLYLRGISGYCCRGRIKNRLLATAVFTTLLVNILYISSTAICHARMSKRPDISSLIHSLNMKAELRTNSTEGKHLLTFFTTWPEDKTREENIVTAINWASLKPFVKPVIFMSQGTLARELSALGFDVLPVTKSALGGIPVLKTMFLDVLHKYSSHFYGYANSDILFDRGLIRTLSSILDLNQYQETPLLVVGQRTNVNDVAFQIVNSSNLYQIAEKGTLFSTLAMDYFITNAVFPWKEVPDLVVGRIRYDNWLLLHSVERDFSVIDATKTILAVHQTTCIGNRAGSKTRHAYYNQDLLSEIYGSVSYHKGRTTCAALYTEFKNGIIISKREVGIGCHSDSSIYCVLMLTA